MKEPFVTLATSVRRFLLSHLAVILRSHARRRIVCSVSFIEVGEYLMRPAMLRVFGQNAA